MNEEQIKNILQQVDQQAFTASELNPTAIAHSAREQYTLGKKRRIELLVGGGFVLVLMMSLLGYHQYDQYQQKQIALNEQAQKELAALKVETQHTLALIQYAKDRTQRHKNITKLRQKLASMTPHSKTEKPDKNEQLAASLYQKAQTLSTKTNSCSAVKMLYQQIIRTFPKTKYSRSAKEKLAQLNCLNGI